MPEFKSLDRNYIICSHAFINTINFSTNERIRIDENNEKVGSTTGIELEKFVLDKKKEIDSLYSK